MEFLRVKKSNMVSNTILEYILYIKNCVVIPLTSNLKTIALTSSVVAALYSGIDNIAVVLSIHSFFLIAYFLLAFIDSLSGMAASMYVEKEKFSSPKFLKKILLVGFCLVIMFVINLMIIVFSNYKHSDNFMLNGFLEVVVFAFHVIKIALMLAFIIYELTSLRENFVRLRLYQFVKIVDIVIYPLVKLNGYLDSKYEAVLATTKNAEPEKTTENETNV